MNELFSQVFRHIVLFYFHADRCITHRDVERQQELVLLAFLLRRGRARVLRRIRNNFGLLIELELQTLVDLRNCAHLSAIRPKNTGCHLIMMLLQAV